MSRLNINRLTGRWTVSTLSPFVSSLLIFIKVFHAFAPGISLSVGESIALLVVTLLAVLIASIIYTEVSQHRRAAAFGARLIPRIRGYLPGNVDIAVDVIKKMETEYIGTSVLEQMQLHGHVVNMRFLWEEFVFTAEPQDIKNSLTIDFKNYPRGKAFKRMTSSVLGSGIIPSDGDTWKFYRTMTAPFFNIDRISDLDIFDRHSESAITLMKERFRLGLAVDFQDIVSRFTFDSASEFLFGHCADTLSAELPYPFNFSGSQVASNDPNIALNLATAINVAQQVILRRNIIGASWPLFEFFGDDTREPMKFVDAFLEPILKDAIAKYKGSQGFQDAPTDTEDECLLNHFIRQTTDIKVLRDQIINVLFAARDTTAAALTFAVYLMATHKDVLRRLREEILEKVGPTRRPSYEDIRGMEYLRAVIDETLRLFPPIPYNMRECVNDTIWQSPDPHAKPLFVPAGTTIVQSLILMQRRTDLWGPDALEFDPDRFLDDRLHQYLTSNPSIFLPFSAGPRICLGKKFAYNEVSFMLIRLLQQFSCITLSPESEDPADHVPAAWARGEGRQAIEQVFIKHTLSMYVQGGLWVKMEPIEI